MSQHEKISTPKKTDSNTVSVKSKQIPVISGSHPEAIIQRVRAYPESMTYADAMILQRTVGNDAVSQLMKERDTKPIQRETASKVQEEPTPETLRMMSDNKTGLPDNLKAGIENLSGLSMNAVRVHYSSDKPAQVGALAYTKGTDIHIAPGQEKHLPHEAWHVVQQAQGRVRPTMLLNGLAVNDAIGLEREASEMGQKAKIAGIYTNQDLKCMEIRGHILQRTRDDIYIVGYFFKMFTEGEQFSDADVGTLLDRTYTRDGLKEAIEKIEDDNARDFVRSKINALLECQRRREEEEGSTTLQGGEPSPMVLEQPECEASPEPCPEPDDRGYDSDDEDDHEQPGSAASTEAYQDPNAPIDAVQEAGMVDPEDAQLTGMVEPDDAQPDFSYARNLVCRHGHCNDFRHGTGHASTLAILIKNDRELLTPIVAGADTFDKLGRLDRKIKRINDMELRLIRIKARIGSALEAFKAHKSRVLFSCSVRARHAPFGPRARAIKKLKLKWSRQNQESFIEEIDLKVKKLKEKRDALRRILRSLYKLVFWNSEVKKAKEGEADYDWDVKERQKGEIASMAGSETFKDSAELRGKERRNTDNDSEQQIIVSHTWRQEINSLVAQIEAKIPDDSSPSGSNSGEIFLHRLSSSLTTTELKIMINRSPCLECNAFLVAELILFWKEIARIIKEKTGRQYAWEGIRDELRKKFKFKITFSKRYYSKTHKEVTKGDFKILNSQLDLAGWEAGFHKIIEPSDTERDHEDLKLGKKSKGSHKKDTSDSEDHESDPDYTPPEEGTESS
ncbi:MAG: DUF4157 domain-containing protein [Clostridia bacterium]|nr:DUF4157 domain-containing protein [Clostridia bacterium]